MLSYNTYIKYNNIITNIYKDNKELNLLYIYLNKLHEKYKKDLSFEEFSLYVLTNCVEKDKESLTKILSDIKDVDVDSTVLDDIVLDIQQKQKA